MIIIGHELIPYKTFIKIEKIKDNLEVEEESIILFDFYNKEVLKYISENDVSFFATKVENAIDACLANALGVKYILVEQDIASSIQKIADEYLFDSKILLIIDEEKEMSLAIKDFIDGVIFKTVITDLAM